MTVETRRLHSLRIGSIWSTHLKDRSLQKIEAGCGRRYRVEGTRFRAGSPVAFTAHCYAK